MRGIMDTLIEQLRAGGDLGDAEVAAACAALLDETAGIEPRAEFLRALAAKGETPVEIAAFVRELLARAEPVAVEGPVIDVCGTGGDRLGLFNVSTAVMFVVAACGVRVVKHGNRGVTSKSGGADVLEALGVRIEVPPARVAEVLGAAGCVFLFAPGYHPAFKAVGPVRRWLAERGETSVFNKLGPLLNPARPAWQLAGVFDPAMTEVYAAVFAELGRERAWAVHGETPEGGLDEMSTLGPTRVRGAEGAFTVDALDYGIARAELAALRGGDAAHNAGMLTALLAGPGEGPLADIVAWNAAGALVVAGRAGDLREGLAQAREAIASGAAAARLEALREATG